MDWGGCPIKFLIWGGMDLDPGSWGGLELGLKIGPVKTSTHDTAPPPKRCTAQWRQAGRPTGARTRHGGAEEDGLQRRGPPLRGRPAKRPHHRPQGQRGAEKITQDQTVR